MKARLRLLLRWQYVLGLLITGFYIAVAVAAPYLATPDDPVNFSPYQFVKGTGYIQPIPPGEGFPLGTVGFDRSRRQVNIFYTLVWGTRSALKFGLIVTLLAGTFGTFLGAASGYWGGPANQIIMRVNDAFMSFPIIAGVVLFTNLLTTVSVDMDLARFQNLVNQLGVNPVMLCLIVFSWMPYCRMINHMAVSVKEAEYIQAARALGASRLHVIVRHLLPQIITPAIVMAARDIGSVVLIQATFTYIGLGGESEWGSLLVFGKDWIIGPGGNILKRWWVFLPTTLTLVFFGVGWNLLGDCLNEWLNPRLTQETSIKERKEA